MAAERIVSINARESVWADKIYFDAVILSYSFRLGVWRKVLVDSNIWYPKSNTVLQVVIATFLFTIRHQTKFVMIWRCSAIFNYIFMLTFFGG